jgi:uncharacterized membrane-anchored protein
VKKYLLCGQFQALEKGKTMGQNQSRSTRRKQMLKELFNFWSKGSFASYLMAILIALMVGLFETHIFIWTGFIPESPELLKVVINVYCLSIVIAIAFAFAVFIEKKKEMRNNCSE